MTDKVIYSLAIDAEAAGVIWHDTFSLSRPNCERSEEHLFHWRELNVPAPQRLVFPLMQNLHCRHSVKFR